jgi:hypothetical protein
MVACGWFHHGYRTRAARTGVAQCHLDATTRVVPLPLPVNYTKPHKDEMSLLLTVMRRATCAHARRSLLGALAVVALLSGCGGSSQPGGRRSPSVAATSRSAAGPVLASSPSVQTAGPMPARRGRGSSRVGRTSSAGAPASTTTAGFDVTIAFARCMRSHGVPNFPNPTGRPGLLGPGSGVDLSSPRFQSAVNGPCRSLAPPAWVSSGPVSSSGGGGS